MHTILNTPRKYLSEVLSNFNDLHNVEYHFARVTVANADAVAIDPIGQPVVWDGTNFAFVDEDTDLAEVTTPSTLPDGSPVAVVVGSNMGVGINDHDVTVDSDGVELTVVYRGPSSIKVDHIDWDVLDADGDASVTPAGAAVQAAVVRQLEAQGVAMVHSAEVINPTYVGE